MSALLDAALAYAARGWWVFPLDGKGGHLTGKGGHRNATTDRATIRAWWRRWPDASIGVWLRRSGLLVIDYDGEPGRRTLARLEEKHGPLPRTLHQRSPSGGGHIFMLDPGGDPDSSESVRGNFGRGSRVDIKCNGYVLLEPSRTKRGDYKLVADGAPEPVPDEWRPHLVPRDTGDGGGGDVAAWLTTEDVGRDLADLPGALHAIGYAGEGGTMLRAICTIFEDFGLSIDDGWRYLVEWNARRREPLTEGQLMRQIDRVGEKKAGRGARWKRRLRIRQRAVSSDLVCLADVEAERVEWLWHARIPLGKITVVDGDPGLGKSTMTLDLAARVTRGDRMPEDAHPRRTPADVVLMSAEDGPADTIRPRADAASADVRRIHLWVATREEGGDARPPSVGDCEELERIIRQTSAALVVIDPFVAYLPDDKNSHNDHDMRRAMAPLARIADATRAAIVLVRHLKKSGEGAIYRGGGSIGIAGAARSVLLVAKDREDETGETRVLAPVKSNLAREAPALRYKVVDADGVGRIEWLGVAEGVSADDLVSRASPREPTKTDACATWLREFLSDGPQDRDAIARAAEAYAYTEKVLRRAREQLGVVDERYGRGRTRWALPGGAS